MIEHVSFVNTFKYVIYSDGVITKNKKDKALLNGPLEYYVICGWLLPWRGDFLESSIKSLCKSEV